MKTIRPWTKLEERRAVALRAQCLTIGAIARLLGRPYSAVSVKLSRLNATRRTPRRPRGGFLLAVRRACRPGRSDREVATILRSTHQEVYRARRKLGIPAGITLADAARRRNAIRFSRQRCWVCDKRCPRAFSRAGWKQRNVTRNNPDRETYCPACFALHGWPPRLGRWGHHTPAPPAPYCKPTFSIGA